LTRCRRLVLLCEDSVAHHRAGTQYWHHRFTCRLATGKQVKITIHTNRRKNRMVSTVSYSPPRWTQNPADGQVGKSRGHSVSGCENYHEGFYDQGIRYLWMQNCATIPIMRPSKLFVKLNPPRPCSSPSHCFGPIAFFTLHFYTGNDKI
jgi:hypothetical protein